MKKSSGMVLLLVTLALLSAPIFAQSEKGPAVPPVPTTAFEATTVGLQLQTTLTYGDHRQVNFTPIKPCRLVNTFEPRLTMNNFPTGPFQDGEVRTYSFNERDCAGRIPGNATDVAVRVVTFGITNTSVDWYSPGGRVLFTTLSSPTNSGGVMRDARLPGFAYFVAGQVLENWGLVQTRIVPDGMETNERGLGIQVNDGRTDLVLDVVAYATASPNQPSPQAGGMVWRGEFDLAATYAVNNMVKYEGNLFICVGSAGHGCTVWDRMTN